MGNRPAYRNIVEKLNSIYENAGDAQKFYNSKILPLMQRYEEGDTSVKISLNKYLRDLAKMMQIDHEIDALNHDLKKLLSTDPSNFEEEAVKMLEDWNESSKYWAAKRHAVTITP